MAADPTTIIEAVAGHYQVAPTDLTGPSRRAPIVRARHTAMWALRHHGLSYPKIGTILNRDHTTVIHGVASIEGARRANPNLNRLLEDIA